MLKLKYLPLIVLGGLFATFAATVPVFAANGPSGGWGEGMHNGPMMGLRTGAGVFGTVSGVSGNTVTVTQKVRPNASTTPIVYSVDATNAKIIKNGTTTTISSIVTGDTVMVAGTVNGTSVTATAIRDGVAPGMMGGRGGFGGPGKGVGHGSSSTPPVSPIQGNGQPVVGGNVTGINGNSVTITNASNVTYTVDVTSAKIVKNGTTTTVSNVATGDAVVVQGTVNGTAIVAASVLDQGAASSASAGAPAAGPHPGFFGAIGNFFKHMFGF